MHRKLLISQTTELCFAAAPEHVVRNQLVERGFEMMATTPEQAQANYKTEFEVITRRIKELGIEQQ